MKDIQITENFWLSEFLKSQVAIRNEIENVPTDNKILENLQGLCIHILQPLRWAYDKPLIIASGFRAPELNTILKGALDSPHLTGNAADFTIEGIPNDEVALFIQDNLHYDAVGLEYWTGDFTGWIHCSYKNVVDNQQTLFYKTMEGTTFGSLTAE